MNIFAKKLVKQKQLQNEAYQSNRVLQTESKQNLSRPKKQVQMDDEEVKKSENVEDDAIESRGTKSANVGKAAQVVAPRMMSLAITGKTSLMHQSFPELLSPKHIRLESEMFEKKSLPDSGKNRNSNRQSKQKEQPGTKLVKKLNRPPTKQERIRSFESNSSEDDGDIDVKIAYQKLVQQKNKNIEANSLKQKKMNSFVENPKTATS